MMKILKRYVLGEFLKPYFGCLILFISLSWIIDLFEHIDEIVKARVPLFVLCDYYFSLTPYIFVQISPIIIILATIYTLGSLNKNNEIMAIKAIGVNLWSIIGIFIGFGLLVPAARDSPCWVVVLIYHCFFSWFDHSDINYLPLVPDCVSLYH